jgi:hypothetical protein
MTRLRRTALVSTFTFGLFGLVACSPPPVCPAEPAAPFAPSAQTKNAAAAMAGSEPDAKAPVPPRRS